jgi:hypothetical protein
MKMKKWTLLAAMIATASIGMAQDTVHTESSTVSHTDAAGTVESSTAKNTSTHTDIAGNTSVKTETSSYEKRNVAAYEAAGVPAADIARLRDIDLKAREAMRANDHARVKTYYQEQTKILTPTRLQKVNVYLKAHPVPAAAPAYAVTTYEYVPTSAGVHVDTPIGSIGVGIPTGHKVVERTDVVPAPAPVEPPPPAPAP